MAVRTVTYRLAADITRFTAQMRQAGASASQLANQLTGADDAARSQREALSDLGDQAGKVGLVAAAGLGAAVAAAANFDQAMSGVQAATHESQAGMEALRAAALQAGADTAFSASEAAGGIEALAKAGVSTSDILGGGLKGALDLAAAGSLDVGDAAEQAATAMTQFGLSGQDVPHIADLLAAAAGKAQGEVSDFGQALNQAGLIANSMGISIEETTGSLAAFASAGLLGSDAGTSLKTMLQRLSNPSDEAAAKMKQLGISAYDANGNFVGLESIAGQLQVAFQGQSSATRDAAMATIFGSDAVRAANVLYSEGAKGIANWTRQVDDQGFAAETAAIKLDNLKGDLEALGGSLETALIGIGDSTQGPLRQTVQGITAVVNAFNELPPVAHGTAAALLAVTAVTGGGLFFGAKMIQGIAETRAALTALNITLGPSGTLGAMRLVSAAATGLALGGVAAATAGLVMLGDKLLDVNLTARDTKTALSDLAAGDVNDQLANLSVGFDSLGDALSSAAFDDLGSIMPDFMSSVDEIEQLDAALGKLAERDPRKAAEAFATIRSEAEAAGVPIDELLKLFPQLDAAMKQAGQSILEPPNVTPWMQYGSAVKSAAGANDKHAQSARQDAAAIEKQTNAMREARSEAIRAANAQINYQASIDDARRALRDNGRTLDITTDKGRANRTALLNMAAAWNDQSAAAKSAQGAHRAAIGAFVRTATQMGMNEDAARRYAQRLFEIPPGRQTKIENNADQARQPVERYHGALNSLPRSVQTFIQANSQSALAAVESVRSQLANLNGSVATTYVRTVKIGGGGRDVVNNFAEGGYISGPGTATSDSIPIWGSNGEYMVKAAAVDFYGRQFFDRVNAMRYAQGGLIQPGGAGRVPVSSSPDVLHIVGTLDTPFGPAEVRGIARSEVDQANRARDRRALAGVRT